MFFAESITILRHFQILCWGSFSCREPLSSISFERDSELKVIESKAFYSSFLKSITIPDYLQLLCLIFSIASDVHRSLFKWIQN
jgi:hypothetical protein